MKLQVLCVVLFAASALGTGNAHLKGVQPCSYVRTASSALYLNNAVTPSQPTLRLTQVADLITHTAQVDSVHDEPVPFPATDALDPPLCSVLLVLDGISDDALDEVRPSLSFAENRVALDVSEVYGDDIAQVGVLMSGEQADENGILGREFRHRQSSEAITAYSNNGQALSASVADMFVLQARHGLSPITVAVSGDAVLADALSPRRSLAYELERSYTYGWDTESNAFWSRHGSHDVGALLSRDDVLEAVRSLDIAHGSEMSLSVSDDGTALTVEVGDLSATFNMKNEADFLFIAELVAMDSVAAVAAQHSSLSRQSADLVAIGISSLALMGMQPFRFRVHDHLSIALLLIDAAFQEATKQLDASYGRQVASEVVVLEPALVPSFTSHHIRAVQDNSTNGTTYTAQQVADYQTALWSSVFLAVTLVLIVYTFYNMDVGADSILYRTTSGGRPQNPM